MKGDKYFTSYRFLAFLAVSCALAGVAWATRDLLVVAIGIPGLAAGHTYSWHRRETVLRRRTVALYLLAILLIIYLGQAVLFSGLSDRMLLSRYLGYGVALGSFDLMRRRNVLGSLILGGLLLTLVSELALSLVFAVFPVVFLVLALATVAVSRIEVEASRVVVVGKLNWFSAGKVWLGFAAGTLLLSAVFFVFMPRLANSQVVQAAWLPSRLDLSLRGLAMLPGRPSAPLSLGILPSFQDGSRADGEHADLGYVGSFADRPVMHVRSRISSYWRGITLDQYDGLGWLTTSPRVRLLDENRGEFVLSDSRLLTGQRAYWQTYYLMTDQPNALFTGYNPGRIYLPYSDQVFLESGSLYRALSPVPNVRAEWLRRDGAVRNDLDNLFLPSMPERVADLAESIVEGAPTDYDKAARLERFLLENYPYQLDVAPVPPEHDAVDYFLFEQQAGYCAHFATAMAVMARQVGLPARVAGGYLPGVIDPMTGAHVVRVGDAHAWVEIHFQRQGWVAFDPTPRPDATMGFAAARNWIYFGLEEFTGISFAGMLSPLTGNLSFKWLSRVNWLWAVWLIAAVAVAALARRLLRRKVGHVEEMGNYSVLDGEARIAMLKVYHKMTRMLAGKNLPPRQPYQAAYEYAAIVNSQALKGREMVKWLSHAATNAAYNPGPFDSSIPEEARQKLSALRRALDGR